MSVELADLSGDGLLDLVSADFGSDTLSIHVAEGDGSFGNRITLGTGLEPYSVKSADLNRDGKVSTADLVIVATPIDLRRLIKFDKPVLRVRYELQEIGEPTLADLLSPVLAGKDGAAAAAS